MALTATLLLGLTFVDFGLPLMASEIQPPQKIAPYPTSFVMPQDIVMPTSPDSPGQVTFAHTSHVDDTTPTCGVCHASTYSILKRTTKSLGEKMHTERSCGQCHDGEKAFNWEDNCETCHIEP